MKKFFMPFLAIIVLLSLCSCGGKTENKKSAEDNSYSQSQSIKKQLENTTLEKGYWNLVDIESDDWYTVLCKDNEATITIKAAEKFTIPNVAEIFIPIVKKATQDAGVELSSFEVSCYRKNKNGIVEGTFASWNSKDCVVGNFATDAGGKSVVKFNLTVDDLYEYFADYKEIVEKIISGAE